MRKQPLLWVALILAVVIWRVWFPGTAFDGNVWREEGQDPTRAINGERYDMAVRLVARRTLMGLTRPQVVEMLGEPLERDELHPDPELLVYHLGPERSFFAMDSEWLSVILGPDGRVVRCKIWED